MKGMSLLQIHATRRSGVAAQRQLLDAVPVKNGESEKHYTGSGSQHPILLVGPEGDNKAQYAGRRKKGGKNGIFRQMLVPSR